MEITDIAIAVGLCILSYMGGSIMSAVLVSRILRLSDPRTMGSKNPGATNMLRLHGKLAGAMTLAGDIAKGVLPVLAARYLKMPELVVMLCATCAFSGHLFPLFHRLRGGKGVATFFGILWAIHWSLGLAFTGCWLLLAALWRYSSLASIIATLASLVAGVSIMPQSLYALAPISILLIWRHQGNISLLIAGEEKRIGEKPK